MAGDTDSAKIARIDQKTISIERILESHLNEDTRRFEMVFSHFNERLDRFEGKIDERFTKFEKMQTDSHTKDLDPLKSDVKTLWDERNSQNGFLRAGRLLYSILGGCIGAGITIFTNQHGGSGMGNNGD